MTAAAIVWPRTGRLECYGAFPDTPDLLNRGASDAVGNLYQRMQERGEIQVYPGRVTPVSEFIRSIADRLHGQRVTVCGMDRYRKAEATQAMEAAKVNWPIAWRGQGASAKADGSHDVRAFQRMVLSHRLVTEESLIMEHAISESSLRYDGSGNPALDKARAKGRIDALQAAVIACGLSTMVREKRGLSVAVIA